MKKRMELTISRVKRNRFRLLKWMMVSLKNELGQYSSRIMIPNNFLEKLTHEHERMHALLRKHVDLEIAIRTLKSKRRYMERRMQKEFRMAKRNAKNPRELREELVEKLKDLRAQAKEKMHDLTEQFHEIEDEISETRLFRDTIGHHLRLSYTQ